MICTNCEKHNEPESNYCAECGVLLEEVSIPTPEGSCDFARTGKLIALFLLGCAIVLFAACALLQRGHSTQGEVSQPSIQQGMSLLSTEPITAPIDVVETGGIKEAVSVEAFTAVAEELSLESSHEVLQFVDADAFYLFGITIAAVECRDTMTAIGLFELAGPRDAEVIFVTSRNSKQSRFGESGVQDNISGLNYNYFSIRHPDGFAVFIRVDNTVLLAEGALEGIDVTRTFLEAIGYY